MNTKRISIIGCVLALSVLIALGGFWQPAAAKSGIVHLEEGQTIGMGTQGLHVTNVPVGVTHVFVDNVGWNLPPRFSHKVNMQLRSPAMEVRFLDAKGGEVGQINALVYVYFNIARAERELWLKSGMDKIAIWFANEQTGSWEICPTYFIPQSRMEGTVGRLTCLAPGSGYYVLGQGDFGKYLPRSQPVTAATLKVRAFIDGRSQLIIRGSQLYWHHLDFQAPGRWVYGGGSKPTYLNKVSWEPTWPDKPDSTNQDCNCSSSTYQGIPVLAGTIQTVRLNVVQGRGAVHIIQQPNETNNYTLIIEFDDNPLDGAAWYEINLGY